MTPNPAPGLHDAIPLDAAARTTSAQLLSLGELAHSHPADAPAVIDEAIATNAAAFNPLHHVKATLTVCVGTVELTVGELLGAREQQVLRLDQAVEQPVDVLLNGAVIARGTLVAVDDHFGVRITELPRPLVP